MYTIQSIEGDIAWVEYNGETIPAPATDTCAKPIVIVGSKNGTVCFFFESMEVAKEWQSIGEGRHLWPSIRFNKPVSVA